MKHPRREEGRAGKVVENAGALHTLADDVVALVRSGDIPDDIGDRADAMEVVGAWIVDLGIPLQQDSDRPLLAQCLLRGGDRFRPRNGDRRDDRWKQHDVADGDDDQGVRRDRNRLRIRGGGG